MKNMQLIHDKFATEMKLLGGGNLFIKANSHRITYRKVYQKYCVKHVQIVCLTSVVIWAIFLSR